MEKGNEGIDLDASLLEAQAPSPPRGTNWDSYGEWEKAKQRNSKGQKKGSTLKRAYCCKNVSRFLSRRRVCVIINTTGALTEIYSLYTDVFLCLVLKKHMHSAIFIVAVVSIIAPILFVATIQSFTGFANYCDLLLKPRWKELPGCGRRGCRSTALPVIPWCCYIATCNCCCNGYCFTFPCFFVFFPLRLVSFSIMQLLEPLLRLVLAYEIYTGKYDRVGESSNFSRLLGPEVLLKVEAEDREVESATSSEEGYVCATMCPCFHGCMDLMYGTIKPHDYVNMRFVSFALLHNIPHVVIVAILLSRWDTEGKSSREYEVAWAALVSSIAVSFWNLLRVPQIVMDCFAAIGAGDPGEFKNGSMRSFSTQS